MTPHVHQDKSSSVGAIENCQNKDVGIENHLSNDSIGGMKNQLLHDGCLLMTHFQPVYFDGGAENRLSNDLIGGIKTTF